MPDDLARPFEPDWTLAPAATLRAWMKENAVTSQWLWMKCMDGGNLLAARTLTGDVLAGHPIGERHAAALERGTGISAAFWLRLEANYRDGLAAGLTDVTPEDPDGPR